VVLWYFFTLMWLRPRVRGSYRDSGLVLRALMAQPTFAHNGAIKKMNRSDFQP
jgi:hypothetical protein